MSDNPKKRLAHVLWMGGATDTGKSTIAENLAFVPRQGSYGRTVDTI